ncbi:amidohydrolase [Asanoa iriomotensis]|uniref:Hippurate hydrolase n=1 Tax=Asanoa iriomotensis TaxID=234613 RepID=A0ABQ4C032_9ACTN|nr:amidohydrolase [Asanoa iriomotensis]GIF56131.1 hippurate hydrolase [Asanoa iriomotensis]
MATESPQEAAGRARAVLADLDGVLPEVDTLYQDLHTNPELSGAEVRTAGIIGARYKDAGLEVTPGVGGLGVVGVLTNGPGPVVGVRADFDALPIAEDTGLPYASTAVGTRADGTTVPVMHACGHDLHTASLIGAAQLLAAHRDRWRGTLVLIAQPAEETMQGAKAMLGDGLFDRFPRPDVVLAQHCAITRTGMVHHKAGIAYSACRNFRITIHGRGAHGAAPHWSVDPVLLAAQTIVLLQGIVAREVDPDEMTVLTVGSVHAGTRPNIIPPEAVLEVTLRATSEPVMDQLQAAMERIVNGVAVTGRAPRPPEIELCEHTIAVDNDDTVTARVRAVHAELFGAADVIDLPEANKGSEDFAYYASHAVRRIPATMWFYGSTAAALWDAADGDLRERMARMPGQHTPFYAPDRLPTLRRGVETLVAGALAFLPGRPA